MAVRILCIGDVVGRPGRAALGQRLPALVKRLRADCVIVNAENIADGSGITPPLYNRLKRYGVHLISMGDHAYRHKDGLTLFHTRQDMTRPANLGPDAVGPCVVVHELADGTPIALFTLLGRLYMKCVDCFFRTADHMLAHVVPPACKLVMVDMHAEATGEKVALGWHLDGRVTCVFGTHTHVQTADERVLPQGTAYITDLGMTGPHSGVLGRRHDRVIESLITHMPTRYDVAEGDLRIHGALVEADPATGKALSIQRVSEAVEEPCDPDPA